MFNVLVIGDIIQDRYAYVATERMSAEAPIPVWDELRSEVRFGGSANVAYNLKNMFADDAVIHVAGITDTDMEDRLDKCGFNTDLVLNADEISLRGGLVVSNVKHSTIIKQRFVKFDSMEYIARFDNARKFENVAVAAFKKNFIKRYRDMFFDAVIISDYNAGTIDAEIAELLCKEQKFSPVFVDSKREDLSIFNRSFFLKVNKDEFSKQVSSKLYPFFQAFFDNVVITLGSGGCELMRSEPIVNSKAVRTDTERFFAEKVSQVDVTGCGDTFVAAVVYYLLNVKNDLRKSLMFANKCAANVVQKFGTAVISREEINVLSQELCL